MVMESTDKNVSMTIYSQMQSGEPYKTYKKVIPSWVAVTVLNVFNDRPERITLKGDPAVNDIDCYVPLWSDKEYLFFKRQNRNHIADGRLIESTYPKEEDIPQSVNNLTEKETIELVNGPFMTLKRRIEKMDSEAAVYRVVQIAEQQERPEKTMNFLRESLSRLQLGIKEEEEED
jgi:hypothetical protein